MEIDNEYWNNLQKIEGNYDPLATIHAQLKSLQDYAEVINKILPSIINSLEKERKAIVLQTEKTFSDILSMISVFNDGEESLYETAVRICDYYKEKDNKGE